MALGWKKGEREEGTCANCIVSQLRAARLLAPFSTNGLELRGCVTRAAGY